MTIEAELADGRILEFPDGTDPKVIQGVVKKLVSAEAPAPAPPATWGGTVLPAKQLQQLEADANAGNANAQDVLRAYKEVNPTGRRLTQAEGEAARRLTGNAPPVQQAPAPAPAKATTAAPAPTVMGGDDAWAAITEAGQPKSVLEGRTPTPPAPGQNLVNLGGVSPQYVASLEAQFNAMPAAQRGVALQQAIAANPENTVKGRAFRAF